MKNLKKYRLKANLTQEKLAFKLHEILDLKTSFTTTINTISSYERSENNSKGLEKAMGICKILGCTLEELTGFKIKS